MNDLGSGSEQSDLCLVFKIKSFSITSRKLNLGTMKQLLLCLTMLLTLQLDGQIDLGYQLPHKDILDLADAPLPPRFLINDEATVGILFSRSNFKTIEELSEEEMRLAGLRINPKTNISSRTRYYTKIEIMDIKSGTVHAIKGIPERARFANLRWSPDQSKMSFTTTETNGVALWVIDIASKSAKKITKANINANMRGAIVWMKDSQSILYRKTMSNANLINAEEAIPTGPTISVNDGKKAQNRTYQDLLKNKTDEHNFMQLATAEIWKVDMDGNESKWKDAGMYSYTSVSPDGKNVLIGEVKKPFSYIVPYYRFPVDYIIYDANGKEVKNFLSIPLTEDLPKGFMACIKGPRSLSWRDDKPATLVWAEALDEGDPENEVEYRDVIYEQDAPFIGKPNMLLKTINRFNSIEWGDDNLAICYDYWWNDRNTKAYLFDPADNTKEPKVMFDRNYQDRYNDPGNFVTRINEYGNDVIYSKDGNLFLIGDGYSDEGIYPFVDKLNLKTNETERLYQAKDKSRLERLWFALDMDEGKILSQLQSPTEYPNFYVRNINDGSSTAITEFENPFKALENVHKELITYKRDDGVELSATLYLPEGYKKESDGKLPMVMWAYPREFKDASTAGQVTQSENEFTYPYYGSPIYWVNRGYAVLDDAAFPIIGQGEEEPNDTFIPQLVANAKAAIDAVDGMGFIDRDRVAVGGHSYGAFMTANLLSHSNLFAAGIARSGAYNRTLTPFGFQAEERTYWEAPEIYYGMSPFMHADKMKTPLLLIHGQADNNSGTYPMQSERYFNALKGLGATVRLVMLPKESHGYAARESVMHILWEQDEWLEKYVKNKNKQQKEKP